MARTEKIFLGKRLLGIKIKSLSAGSTPVTDSAEPLQVLTLNHPKGALVKPHFHRPTKRVTNSLQECLVVLKGKIRVDFYGSALKPLKRVVVKAGEAFIIVSGTNSVHYLEDSQVIETKNGPFKDDTVKITA